MVAFPTALQERDYGGFGPFEFDRAAYEGAIEEAFEGLR